jgi:pimeloyl-ACP methyl ester carboxylesterase
VSEDTGVDGVGFRFIETNGIRMRIAEIGDGPLVVLAHGWPESWYSWRHQMTALAAAGYRAVAPDMRGYGESDKPDAVEAYDIELLASDIVGLIDSFGVDRAHLIGHDWGSIVAANTALFSPERLESLTLMSVPFSGRPLAPWGTFKELFGDDFFYILYHNEPEGIAEAEYDADPRGLLSRLYLSPDSPRYGPEVTDPLRGAGGWIPRLGAPKGLPPWLSDADLDYFVDQFERSGFRGGVNYYRNLDRNWEITEPFANTAIEVPTIFIAGEKDGVIGSASREALEQSMSSSISNLRDVVLISDVGHWVQQEEPQQTNDAIVGFLGSV